MQLNGIRPTQGQKELLEHLLNGAIISSGVGLDGPSGFYNSHTKKAIHPNAVKSMLACGWIEKLPEGGYTISSGGVEVLDKGHTSLGIARTKTRAASTRRS